MATELAKAYVQIIPSAEGIGDGIASVVTNEAATAGDEAGGILGTNFAGAFKAVIAAAGIGMAIKSAVGAVDNFAAYGDEIDKMSQKMGMSAQAYQEWDAVMQHSGTSMETMKASMKTLASAAETGNTAFEQLGITQEQLATMSQQDLFEATIASLQNVDDETQRTYLAGQLLGRGATELGALLNTSAADTQAMRDRVHELGGVLSDEAVANSAAFKDSLQDMQTAIKGIGGSLAAEFLPSFTTVMDGIAELFSGDAGTGLSMIMEGIGGIGAKIIEAVPQIIEAGAQLIGGIVTAIAEKTPDVLASAGQMLSEFLANIMSRMPEIMQKGFEMISNLVQGILNNLPAVVTSIGTLIGQLLATIVTHLPEILAKGVEIVGKIVEGLIQAIPKLVAAIPQLIKAIVEGFTKKDWGTVGSDIIKGVANGITGAVGALKTAVQNAAKKALDAAKDFLGIQSPSKVFRDQVGAMMAEGIAVGFDDNVPTAEIQNALKPMANAVPSSMGGQYSYGGFTINVYGAEGQDVNELANIVGDRINAQIARGRAVFA